MCTQGKRFSGTKVQILTERWRCCWQWQERQERLEACDGARWGASSGYLASLRSALGVLVSVFPVYSSKCARIYGTKEETWDEVGLESKREVTKSKERSQ